MNDTAEERLDEARSRRSFRCCGRVFSPWSTRTGCAGYWRDHILFYEYFTRQRRRIRERAIDRLDRTGGGLIRLFGFLDPEKMLKEGKGAAFRKSEVLG
jgi:hypothetical protein